MLSILVPDGSGNVTWCFGILFDHASERAVMAKADGANGSKRKSISLTEYDKLVQADRYRRGDSDLNVIYRREEPFFYRRGQGWSPKICSVGCASWFVHVE